jgi:predicted acyltransferase
MLLVNDPGSWNHIYAPLEHAPWHGWTPTDLIFPFFVFIVGMTTQLSLSARQARGDDARAIQRQILRRGGLIFLSGLLLNGFPFFTWGAMAGVPEPSFLTRVVHRLLHWRILGVLQRIALAYVVSALIATRVRVRMQVLVTAGLLLAYWVVMTLVPVPGSNGTRGYLLLDVPEATMAAYWDRFVLDWSRVGLGNHLWASTVRWDPEGVLSTTGTICTALLGNVAGWWLGKTYGRPECVHGLLGAGAATTLLGLAWHSVFPINKIYGRAPTCS